MSTNAFRILVYKASASTASINTPATVTLDGQAPTVRSISMNAHQVHVSMERALTKSTATYANVIQAGQGHSVTKISTNVPQNLVFTGIV